MTVSSAVPAVYEEQSAREPHRGYDYEDDESSPTLEGNTALHIEAISDLGPYK
jgi:hypothetical protein